MSDVMRTELIQIGGAGPAGLAAAIILAKAGRRVLVHEAQGEVVNATHQGLADELGSVREMISRLLKNFQDQGLVVLGREQIRILDATSLRSIAQASSGM